MNLTGCWARLTVRESARRFLAELGKVPCGSDPDRCGYQQGVQRRVFGSTETEVDPHSESDLIKSGVMVRVRLRVTGGGVAVMSISAEVAS